MKSIHEIALDNGIKAIARRNSSAPTVSFAFRIAFGDLNDPRGKDGLLDLAASVFTKGTETRSAADLAEQIDALGMETGFRSSRHTSMLSGRVIAENIEPALKLCREMLASAAPSREEVARMQQRLHTALTMQLDDPATVAADRLRTMIYGADHPYGNSIEQRMQGIAASTRDDVIEMLRKHCTSGATRLVIVGDIDVESIESLLQKSLGSWNTGGTFEPLPFEPVDHRKEPMSELIEMPGKTQSDIALGWQGIRRTDDDYYPLLVGNTALGRMSLGGRIGQRVREEEGLAYYAYTSFSAGLGAGPFSFRAGVNPKDVKRAINIALEEMEKAAKDGLTQDEIDDAVTYLSGSLARQMETNGGLASVLLNQDLYGLGGDYYRRFPEILAGLSREQINDALSRNLLTDGYCCAVAGPGE